MPFGIIFCSPNPPWIEDPDPKIKNPLFFKSLKANPILKCYSGSKDYKMDIWITGTLAFGYIIESGINTPWSKPLLVSDFNL